MNKECIGEWIGTEKDEWIAWIKYKMNKDWKGCMNSMNEMLNE